MAANLARDAEEKAIKIENLAALVDGVYRMSDRGEAVSAPFRSGKGGKSQSGARLKA
jgi:hypothetical protein